MSSRPHAHLMLPSPLGLLEYDVLEDAVFLGPGDRGNLRAGPSPFRGALVALTRVGDGYVARPLPGVEKPLINGEMVDEKVLADGDRIRIGELAAMFRTDRGLLTTPPPAPSEPAPVERPPALTRRPPRKTGNPAVTIVVLAGLALILAATYRTVGHLKSIQGARLKHSDFPEMEKFVPPNPSRASRELAQIREYQLRHPTKYDDLVQRYRGYQRSFEGTPEAESANERVCELVQAWSAAARVKLDDEVTRLTAAHQFAYALKAVRKFEQRFGTTKAAEGIEGVRQKVRMDARMALDAIVTRVGPLITPKPREAHRLLIGVSHEFPADMASEVVVLLERCVARMMALSAQRRKERPPPRREPEKPARGDPQLPPLPGGDDDPSPTPEDGAGRPPRPEPGPLSDEQKLAAQARDAWAAAHADLLAAKYAEAVQGYTLLIQQFGNSAYYRENKSKIAAGRNAAKVGALGPQALVHVPATVKKGRLELEYEFNDERVFDEDFTVEQPFSSEMPVQVRWSRGSLLMEKASGVFHRLVFLPDVTIEASIDVQQPHDFGLLAVENSNEFRAILFNIANTRFKLKKGAAAKVNPGHLLWYIGQGVWSAADQDAHGFIKIAEKSRSKLESGDRVKLEFTRRKDSADGTLQGKTDGVHLKGKVKGDDGSTMGPGRVGVFTNSGIIVVNSIRISGVVDMEWFRKELAFLVASDPGPEPDDGR